MKMEQKPEVIDATSAPAAEPPKYMVNGVEYKAQGKRTSSTYKPKSVGIPVGEGQDLRDVPAHVINNWFRDQEQRWKEKFSMRSGGMDATLNLTRG